MLHGGVNLSKPRGNLLHSAGHLAGHPLNLLHTLADQNRLIANLPRTAAHPGAYIIELVYGLQDFPPAHFEFLHAHLYTVVSLFNIVDTLVQAREGFSSILTGPVRGMNIINHLPQDSRYLPGIFR